tara:strand:+ start:108 stop:296 length:189 start_codon:yes stop_codon:yes gene_type:complete
MGSLMQVIYTIFWTLLVVYITTGAFEFFGIGFDVYGIYMLWYSTLSIMSIFLPSSVGDTFNE